ncbi:flagellar hook-basal body complex protein [Desulfobacter latus]|uniref:Flagellar hook protein FlgE n=1 Tax=Desulfobacter latus TaxID=2292 RepID=A0A850TA59_9BACT|nr:flagellar hook-basal body complex protein [Desulfobacter latus]NWH05107.1 flagellar hook-basal body complex protein [Desulfobacter latus]
MSLTSSLYAGTSGLGNTGNALQVTSNNISNINTLGFKKGNATFSDTLYQTIGTNAGTSQVGLGMNVDNVAQVFTDGSLETTSNATDLAIGGDGFFVVSELNSNENYYTRAGNFSFDESGALVTSEGYVLQGWEVEGDTGEEYGAVTDLILSGFTSPPDDTNEITVITNLDSDAKSESIVLSNNFKYDADDGTTMNSDGYEYQTVVTAYDSLGASHEVTVYYDKKSDTEWEYVIACGPDEDARTLAANTDSAGLLARGTISFSESSGDIVSMTMEEFTGVIGNVDVSEGYNSIADVHFEIENSAAIQEDGYGFKMSYAEADGWTLDAVPNNYDVAAILPESSAKKIYIDLNNDGEADLKMSLDEEPIEDIISFDINDPMELHVQDIRNVVYDGGVTADNTTLAINDPSVITTSVEDMSISWDATEEIWSFGRDAVNNLNSDHSTPEVSSLTTSDTTQVSTDASLITINNEEAITTAATVSLVYDFANTKWGFNDGSGAPTGTGPTTQYPSVAIVAGTNDSVDIDFDGDGTADVTIDVTNGGSNTALTDGTTFSFNVDPPQVSTDASLITINNEEAITDAATVSLKYDGTNSKWVFDSTAPSEYSSMTITTGASDLVEIDFDGTGGADVTIDVRNSGANAALTDGTTFSFDVTPPNALPDEYSNATLSGDATYCSIDLDGSGNDDDEDDIVFTFGEELIEDSSITFDIEGSTAWRTVTTDEVEETGYYQFTADFLGGEFGTTETDISFNIGSKFNGSNWINDSLSSTQYARSSSTTYQDSDGYASGDLTGIGVESNGLISGSYSNGQNIALFKIALADFNNPNGLENVGGNLYQATTDSGAAITNKPGENGLGTLSSYALEMSNVDISEEFVDMIGLQTAYEANAKIISTVDELMNTVIGMKR